MRRIISQGEIRYTRNSELPTRNRNVNYCREIVFPCGDRGTFSILQPSLIRYLSVKADDSRFLLGYKND
jgi:hypothetical protein